MSLEFNFATESKGTEVIDTTSVETFSSFKTSELIAINNARECAKRIKKYSSILSDWVEKHMRLKISEDRKSREEFVAINKTPIRKNDIDIDEKVEDIKESRK